MALKPNKFRARQSETKQQFPLRYQLITIEKFTIKNVQGKTYWKGKIFGQRFCKQFGK